MNLRWTWTPCVSDDTDDIPVCLPGLRTQVFMYTFFLLNGSIQVLRAYLGLFHYEQLKQFENVIKPWAITLQINFYDK